jgi:tRNA nucleotidyltransferase (CCA-adding enzyme)
MEELGVLAQIHPGLHCDRWLKAKYRALRQGLEPETWDLKPKDIPFLYLALLSYRLGDQALKDLLDRLKTKRDDADDLHLLLDLRETLPQAGKERRPSAVYGLLEPYPARVLAAAWIATDRKRLRDRLLRYQTVWRLVETEITGDVLKAAGLKPSPLFGRLLGALRDARLDGRVSTREEEEKLLERLLEEEGDRAIRGQGDTVTRRKRGGHR